MERGAPSKPGSHRGKEKEWSRCGLVTPQIAKEGELETAGLQHRAAPGLPRFHEGDENNSDPMSVGGFTYITETGRLWGQPVGAESQGCLSIPAPTAPGWAGPGGARGL